MEGKKMKREVLLEDVRMGVLGKMESTILGGGTRFCYDKQVGTGYIEIEFHEVRCGAFLDCEFEVLVAHEDASKESPMLEAALFAVMPDWFKTKERLGLA